MLPLAEQRRWNGCAPRPPGRRRLESAPAATSPRGRTSVDDRFSATRATEAILSRPGPGPGSPGPPAGRSRRRGAAGRTSPAADARVPAEPELRLARRDDPVVGTGRPAPWIDADLDREQQRGRADGAGEAAVRAAQECTDERHEVRPEGATAPAAAEGARAGVRVASDARAPIGAAGAPAEDPVRGCGGALPSRQFPRLRPQGRLGPMPKDRPGPERTTGSPVRPLHRSRDRILSCCPPQRHGQRTRALPPLGSRWKVRELDRSPVSLRCPLRRRVGPASWWSRSRARHGMPERRGRVRRPTAWAGASSARGRQTRKSGMSARSARLFSRGVLTLAGREGCRNPEYRRPNRWPSRLPRPAVWSSGREPAAGTARASASRRMPVRLTRRPT